MPLTTMCLKIKPEKFILEFILFILSQFYREFKGMFVVSANWSDGVFDLLLLLLRDLVCHPLHCHHRSLSAPGQVYPHRSLPIPHEQRGGKPPSCRDIRYGR